MGYTQSSPFYFNEQELQVISSSNPNLEQYFISIKNYQGYITEEIFSSKILNHSLNKKTSRKLFKLFSSEGTMCYIQLKHFYSCFFSMCNDHKILLITYLIFGTKEEKTHEKYTKHVLAFFSDDLFLRDLLLNNSLIDKIFLSNHVLRKNFTLYLQNHYLKILNSFDFIKRYTSYDIKSNQFEYKCNCSNSNYNKQKKNSTEDEPLYNKMLYKFEQQKEDKKGFYPISLLSQYLTDVHVNAIIVHFIEIYIKKMTNKNFIDYDMFYLIISKLPSENKGSLEFFFNIMSYPHEYIKKEVLVKLIKAITNKDDLINPVKGNLIQIDETLPEEIIKEQFLSYAEIGLSDCIADIRNNLDRIRNIPYLFFDIQIYDVSIESACVQNIMDGKKIDDYAKEQFYSFNESTFYAVQYDFWKEYQSYLSTEQDFTMRPRIDTREISSLYNSELLINDAVYMKDYCLIPNKLYQFIIKLCKKSSNEIIIKKISYPKKKEYDGHQSHNDFRIDLNDTIIELELNPIFVYRNCISHIISSMPKPNLAQMKTFVQSVLQAQNHKSFGYSKISSLVIVKKELMEMYDEKNADTSELVIFYNDSFIRISNENIEKETFNSLEINDSCACLLNTKCKQSHLTYYQIISNIQNSKDDASNADSQLEYNNKDSFVKKNNANDIIAKQNTNNEIIQNQSINNFLKGYIGFENNRNCCYINCVLQIIYNLPLLRKYILSKTFSISISCLSEEKRMKYITYNLLLIFQNHNDRIEKDKLNDYTNQFRPFTIQPLQMWKCIETISPFNTQIQEDAGEFFSYIINEIHNEIKLTRNPNPNKSLKSNTSMKNNLSINEEDNINLFWGFEIKNNPSIINSLFLFLIQSKLQCTKCGMEKKKITTSNNLYLPIPKEEELNITVILHRLPFKFKVYYEKIDNGFKPVLDDIRKSLCYKVDQIITTNNTDGNNESSSQEKDNDQLFLSPLSTSIPITLTVKMKQKDKLTALIMKLRSMKNLELEPLIDSSINNNNKINEQIINEELTTFIVLHEKYDSILNINKEVSSSCNNEDVIHVYELLNSNGMNALYKKNKVNIDLINDKENIKYDNHSLKIVSYNNSHTIIKEVIESSLLHTMNYVNNNEEEYQKCYYEYLVPVKHRYPKITNSYLFHDTHYHQLGFMADYILVNNSKGNISCRSLYDYIWEKYSYALSTVENSIWWDDKVKTKRKCYPFILIIVNGDKGNCIKCPWFRFCQGCSIKPDDNTIIIHPSSTIMVEWCYDLINSTQLFYQTSLTLTYEQIIDIDTNTDHCNTKECDIPIIDPEKKSSCLNDECNEKKTTKTLQDCFDLFFEDESLDDLLTCNYCNTKTNHTKTEKIIKLPKYLMLTLKRFKQMTFSNVKNDSLIDFPINGLVINSISYDLYAIINHSGNSNIGHYYTIIKSKNDKWICLNDKNISIIDDPKKLITNKAYILIYEEKNNINEIFLYSKLFEILLDNWEKKQLDSFIFDGEPVDIKNDGFGIVKESFFQNGEYHVKVINDSQIKVEKISNVIGFIEHYTKRQWSITEEEKSKEFSDCVIY